MRILQLSTRHGFYGGEVHLRDLAAGLRARGHDVHAAVRPGSALAERLAAAGVPVHPLPLVDWFEPWGMLALRRLLRRLRPDVLHTHTPRDYYIAAVATAGTTVVNVGTRHQLRPLGASRLKRPLLRRFAAMIAVSRAARDGLAASGVEAARLVTVHNGIAAPPRGAARADLRAELGLADGAPVIGCVGRLGPEKGLELLLGAARELAGEWPDLRVAVVGGGDGGRYERRLREAATAPGFGPVLRFCGYRAEAARFCPAFDVLAVPSPAEPFGLVTLEAMARGVPVVAARAGGSCEIIRDGVDGLLVAPGDARALAAGLRAVLADADLAARLARAGGRRARREFTLDRQLAATEGVYRAACAAAAGRRERS